MEVQRARQRLFANSIIPMVPQIYLARGCRRKTRVALLVACTLGMMYQIHAFVEIFLSYPTILTIDIEYPDTILAPAITICNRFGIYKDRFCHKHPDSCLNLTKEDDEVETLEVQKEVADKILKEGSKELFEEFGPTIKDTLYYQMTAWDNKDYLDSGNTLTMPMVDEFGYRMACNIFNHQLWEIRDNATQIPSKPWEMHHYYRNCVQGSQSFEAHRLLRRDFEMATALHSPFQMANPYFSGIRYQSGGINVFSISMSEVYLLKAPYRTDCYDYLEAWRITREGPLSQQMCQDQCIYRKTMDTCNCSLSYLLYPNPGRFCEQGDAPCLENVDVEECHTSCKRDCRIINYDFNLRILDPEHTLDLLMVFANLALSKDPLLQRNILEIDTRELHMFGVALKNTEKFVYRYKPKHQTIELFSYIGGYVGVWLAMSVPDVGDVIQIFLRWRQFRQSEEKRTNEVNKPKIKNDLEMMDLS